MHKSFDEKIFCKNKISSKKFFVSFAFHAFHRDCDICLLLMVRNVVEERKAMTDNIITQRNKKQLRLGGSRSLVVMGDDSCLRGGGFVYWTFFTLICC